jgi:glycyl-tRNA synthetase beta chain
VSAYVDMGLSGKQDPAEAVARIEDFFRARTETFLREKGIAQDAVAAVAAVSWAAPGLALGMARAVERLRGDRSFELLITGVKRVGNILPKEMKRYGVPWGVIEEMWLRNGTHGPVRFEARRFEDEAEHALHEAVRRALPTLEESETDADFGSVFAALAALGPVIDRYFDRVLVNSPDPALRANRQQFLAAVFALFSRYADFSRIVEESKTASG